MRLLKEKAHDEGYILENTLFIYECGKMCKYRIIKEEIDYHTWQTYYVLGKL